MFRRTFFVSVPKSFAGVSSSIKKFLVWKIFIDKRGGITFLRRTFLSHSAGKFLGNPSMFQKNSTIKTFFIVKTGGVGGREYHVLQTKVFCLAAPTNIVVETLCVSKTFGYRKSLWIRRWYHYSPLSIFCLIVPTNSVGGFFLVSERFWHQKPLWIEGRGVCITAFSKKIFSHSAESFPGGSLHFSGKFGYGKIFCIGTGYLYFPWHYFVWQCRWLRWGKPTVFQYFWGIENFYG